jgi:PEGA domain
MSTLPQRPSSQPGDGLGYRVLGFDKKTGDRLEMLRVRPQFSGQSAFENALRERLRRLSEFRNPAFARVRQIDRLSGQAAGIAIVSNHVEGVRLADVLSVAESYQVRVDIDTTLCLVRQLASAIASLHTCGSDISHGCIGPERLLLTPDARLVVTEYVLGSSLEAMQWSREKFWQEYRILLPAGPDPATFDQQTDVCQVGLLALALLEGRGVYAERQYPLPLAERLKQAREIPVSGNVQPLKPSFTTWLSRALQMDSNAFRSLDEALVALDVVIGEGYLAAPSMVTAFVDRCRQASPDLKPKEAEVSETMMLRTMQDVTLTPPAGDKPTTAVPPATAKPTDAKPTAKVTPPPTPPAPAAPAKPATPPATPTTATPASGAPPKTAKPADAPASSKPTTGLPAGKTAHDGHDAKGDAKADHKDHAKKPAGDKGPVSVNTNFLGGEMVDDSTGMPGELVAAKSSGMRMPLIAGAVIIVVGLGGFLAWKFAAPGGSKSSATPAVMPASMGIIAIDASPRAATVFVDDVARGQTPVRLELAPGNHTVRLDGGDGVTRTFPVTVTAGKEVSQLVELSRNLDTGGLEVRSDPPGARVLLDGKAVGNSPVSLNDIAPGDHIVVVEGQQGSVRQTVKVIAGTRSSIVVPLNTTPASPAAGWLTVEADYELQVLQDGQLLGTSRAERLMLPAGNYNLEFTNDAMDFHVTKPVQVQPGRVARVSVAIPDGTLSVNATPWAEVWVDGNRIGETPVGNLPMRAGQHEIVFRNPKTGEKKQTIVVKPGQAARVTMDMR